MTRLSNWKEESDLFEVVTGKMTDKEALKKVDEKKGIKNKVVINPKLTEAIKNMGGELISIKEQDEENGNGGPLDAKAEAEKEKEDQKKKQIENKQKRAQMIKKQVLMKKLIAVRAGSEDIVAHYEPDIEGVIEYFYEEGINEEGFDQILEEIGLEEFVDFVEGGVVELNEQRAARKMSVRNLQTLKKKTIPAAKAAEAQRKKEGKGEYSAAYKKKETDVTVYDDKPAAKKKAPAKKTVVKKAAPKPVAKKPVTKKVEKAVAKVKKTQPVKKATKQGLGDRIRSAYKAGVKRHRKATQVPRVFAKGAVAGAKKAVKFAKDVKKVVSEEELNERLGGKGYSRKAAGSGIYKTSGDWPDSDRGAGNKAARRAGKKVEKKSPTYRAYVLNKEDYEVQKKKEVLAALKKRDLKKSAKEKIAADIVKRKGDTSKSDDRYAYEETILEKDLNAKERRALPDKDFVFPGKGEGPEGKQRGAYPIPDKKHARNALAMAAAHASPAKQAKVKAAVKKKFPGIKVSESTDKALDLVRASIIKKHGKGAIYDPKTAKKPSEADKKKAAAESKKRQAERKKRQEADSKAFAARAKKAGYKNPQDYANVVARYGSEDNYKKGRGLGT